MSVNSSPYKYWNTLNVTSLWQIGIQLHWKSLKGKNKPSLHTKIKILLGYRKGNNFGVKSNLYMNEEKDFGNDGLTQSESWLWLPPVCTDVVWVSGWYPQQRDGADVVMPQ